MAATMDFRFREYWRDIKRGRPGHRFQDRYVRAQRSGRKVHAGQRIIFLIAALISIAIGGLLVVFPGPAIPFFFLGGALLASESRVIARAMDGAEVRLRAIFAWGKKRWRRLPGAARVALIVLGACCSAGSAYLGFRLMRG